MSRPALKNSLLASGTAIALLIATPAFAQFRDFNVPAQDARQSIPQFARQAGVQISAPTGRLRGVRTRAIRGNLDARAALRALIEGTGLSIASDTGSMIVLRYGHASTETPGSGEAEAAGAAADSESVEQQIVITGTNIRGGGPIGSPLDVYDREDIARTGASTVEQFVRTLPQNLSAVNSYQNTAQGNPDTGANSGRGSSLNLRGLGTGATLTLVNGIRFAPSGTAGASVDITMIPLAALERIEVLNDGASAIYGADAVAGVVNFITRRNFQGAETTGSYGWTSDGGASQIRASQLVGVAGPAGHLMAGYEYYRQNTLELNQRPYLIQRAGSNFIIPRQERHSVFADSSFNLSDGITLFATGMASHRDYLQDVWSTILLRTTGKVRSYNGAVGLEADLAQDWRLTVTGTYGTDEVESILTRPQTPSAAPNLTIHNSEVYGARAVASGTLFDTPAGHVRASIGAEARHDSFEYASVGGRLSRSVLSAFAEVNFPIVGGNTARPGLERLEVSGAGRFDDFGDEGSSFVPKFGLAWTPVPGLTVRSSYASSYRVAPLAQKTAFSQPFSFQVYAAPDPASPTGRTRTIFNTSVGNPDLRPETSNSFTFGIDLAPPLIPGFESSVTYYRIDYSDRISRPPLVGLTNFYSFLPLLAPFLNRSPDPALIQQIFANNVVFDQAPAQGAAAVQAYVDARPQNIAKSVAEGIDVRLGYTLDTGIGRFRIDATGTLVVTLDFTPVLGGPTSSQYDLIYRPIDFRGRSTLSWSNAGFRASTSINYVDGYLNDQFNPAVAVNSWTTVDFHLGYESRSNESPNLLLRNWSISFSMLNVLNDHPPFAANTNPGANLGYDSVNANPLGRTMTLSITKRW